MPVPCTAYSAHSNSILQSTINDASSEWAGWALAQPELWSSIHPITTTGADFAHHITASPPRFENPAASLHIVNIVSSVLAQKLKCPSSARLGTFIARLGSSRKIPARAHH